MRTSARSRDAFSPSYGEQRFTSNRITHDQRKALTEPVIFWFSRLRHSSRKKPSRRSACRPAEAHIHEDIRLARRRKRDQAQMRRASGGSGSALFMAGFPARADDQPAPVKAASSRRPFLLAWRQRPVMRREELVVDQVPTMVRLPPPSRSGVTKLPIESARRRRPRRLPRRGG